MSTTHPTAQARRTPNARPVRAAPLIVFFALAYGLSWAVWGSVLAEQKSLMGWAIPAEPFVFLAVTVAAVVTTLVFGGPAALRALGSRLVLWRVPVRWYVAAVILPVLPAVAALSVHLLTGGEHDVDALVPLAAAVPLLLTQVVTHLLTEELGWRGVALPRLRRSLSSLSAGLVLGLLWAGWHIPMFFVDGTRQTYPFIGFVVMVVSISVVMTWVWDHTKGSILIAALFHAAMNTSWAVLNILWGDLRLFWLCVAFNAALAAVVATRQVGSHAARASGVTDVTENQVSAST
jgi:uncharacterized protein